MRLYARTAVTTAVAVAAALGLALGAGAAVASPDRAGSDTRAVQSAGAGAASAKATAKATAKKSKTKTIVGQISYFAPGKVIISTGRPGELDQVLHLATTTKVIDNLGDFCLKDKPLPYTCTPAQLEKSLKGYTNYAPWVDVTFKQGEGVALKIVGRFAD